MTVKNRTKKIICSLLIIAMILPSVMFSGPKKASALTVFDPTNFVPNWLSQVWGGLSATANQISAYFEQHKFARWIIEQTLKRFAKALLAKMTQAVINWINSDFHGSPLFLQNPESFFKDIAKSEIRNLVDMIGYDSLRYPFGQQVALSVIESYRRQLEENAQHTLSKVLNDPDLVRQYINDFDYGGWNGFLINTQYPQNNYIGFESTILSDLARRIEGTAQAPAEKVQSLLQQGMGFLSPQTCPSNPAYNNGLNEFVRPSFKSKVAYNPPELDIDPDTPGGVANIEDVNKYEAEYRAQVDAEREAWKKSNTCPGGLVATTPGSVAANQVFNALNVPFLTTALDGALGNSLSAIFDALINHFIDKGLSGLSEVVSGQQSDPYAGWSYNGVSLDGGSAAYGGAAPLNIPQNASVIAGESITTRISGGTLPYIITTPPDPSVATALISTSGSSGPTLTVRGITANRQTFVEIKDSSSPQNTAVVQITVNAIGALTAAPRNVLAGVSRSVNVTISGGEGPYQMIAGPNESVATAVFADTSLVVVGVSSGETSVRIQDAEGNIITIPVSIVGAESLVVPTNITTNVGQTVSTAISGGTPPYQIIQVENPAIANIEIPANTTTILTTGVAAGGTTLVLEDSSFPKKTATVSVTVTNTQALRVSPQNVFTSVGGTIVADVLGGFGDYSIRTLPDPEIAGANIQDDLIIVTGVAPGETRVQVGDSSGQTVFLPIFVGALSVSPQNVSTSVGGIANVTISGGRFPYMIDSDPTAGVATAQIINSGQQSTTATIRVTGRGLGQTSMRVKDSSVPVKNVWVRITVQ